MNDGMKKEHGKYENNPKSRSPRRWGRSEAAYVDVILGTESNKFDAIFEYSNIRTIHSFAFLAKGDIRTIRSFGHLQNSHIRIIRLFDNLRKGDIRIIRSFDLIGKTVFELFVYSKFSWNLFEYFEPLLHTH